MNVLDEYFWASGKEKKAIDLNIMYHHDFLGGGGGTLDIKYWKVILMTTMSATGCHANRFSGGQIKPLLLNFLEHVDTVYSCQSHCVTVIYV